MTDAEIAGLYRRWFGCITKNMKPFGKATAMKRFALENNLRYVAITHRKYTEHHLFYNKETILTLEV